MNRQTLLILFVAFLLVIRFGIVPVSESIAEVKEELDVKTQRFEKGESLLNRKDEIEAQSLKTQASLASLSAVFPKGGSTQEAQLVAQQRLGSIAKKRQLQLQQLEWLDVIEGKPERATLSIEFEGSYKSFIQFVTDIDSLGAWLRVSDFEYRIDNQRVKSNKLGKAKGNLVVEIMYLVRPAV